MSESMLFDTSPIDEDSVKKKPRKTREKQPEPAPTRALPRVEKPATERWLASIDGHYACDRCGITLLDLVDIRKTDKGVKWLISCGWWCLHSWYVDPIPGVLDAEDKKQEEENFRVRGGRFDGMTFDEIDAMGYRRYIEALPGAPKRTVLAEAARKWLDRNPIVRTLAPPQG